MRTHHIRQIVVIALIAMVTQSAWSQIPETASIAGIIVDRIRETPVENAEVVLGRVDGTGMGRRIRTSEDGHFVFRDLAPGEYKITSTRETGYMRASYGQRGLDDGGVSLVLNAGQQLSDVRLGMVPLSAISGRITDENGDPIANAAIHLVKPTFRYGWPMMLYVQGSATNDLGEYRVYALPPGRYYLSVVPPPYRQLAPYQQLSVINHGGGRYTTRMRPVVAIPPRPELPPGGKVYAPVYYPGTTDWRNADEIVLEAGMDLIGADFVAPSMLRPTVSGTVINGGTGGPETESLSVRATITSGIRNSAERVDPDTGMFMLKMDPGAYVLDLRRPDGVTVAVTTLEVGQNDIEDLQIVTRNPVSVPGHVVIDGANTDGIVGPASVSIRLRPDHAVGSSSSQPATRPGPDGQFILDGVIPDLDYRLSVDSIRNLFRQNVYLKSIRLGSQDVLADGLRINGASGDEPEAPFEIVIGTDGGRIEGRAVLDNMEPASADRIVLVPAEPFRHSRDRYQFVDTDANGAFQFQGIAPGDYTLFAWEYVEDWGWENAEYLSQFEGQGTDVHVEALSDTTLDINTIPLPDFLSALR